MKKRGCRRHLSKLPKSELEDGGDGFDRVKQAKPDGTMTRHVTRHATRHVTEPAHLTGFLCLLYIYSWSSLHLKRADCSDLDMCILSLSETQNTQEIDAKLVYE